MVEGESCSTQLPTSAPKILSDDVTSYMISWSTQQIFSAAVGAGQSSIFIPNERDDAEPE